MTRISYQVIMNQSGASIHNASRYVRVNLMFAEGLRLFITCVELSSSTVSAVTAAGLLGIR